MKILLVQDTDWIERNIHQHHHVGERLCQRGHDLTVIDHDLLWRTDRNGRRKFLSSRQVFQDVSKVIHDASVTVIRPRIVRMPILDYVSMLFTYNREIASQLRQSRPDVIVGMYLLTNYLALRASKRNDIPFVFQVLEPNYEMIPQKLFRPLGKYLESKVMQEADHVVVINEGLKEYAVQMGAQPDRVSVIRAGIDFDRFGPRVEAQHVRQQYDIAEDETVLLFVGWLYHFSGLKEVMEALAEYKLGLDKLNVRLLIVGDGDAFDELQRLRTDLGLEDCVTLTGKQPYHKIPEFIAAADICLLPSYNNEIMRDIVPIKMYEYMAMGKPVIATKLPGLIKEFDTGNGVLYVERSEDALNKALELIQAESVREHGEKARHFVRNNSWSEVVDKFEGIIHRLAILSDATRDKSSKRDTSRKPVSMAN